VKGIFKRKEVKEPKLKKKGHESSFTMKINP